MSEEQLRRVKALSAAQTVFLKAYLSGKISSAAALIEDTLRLIESKGASSDPQLTTIRSNLAALKVHELEVWLSSPQSAYLSSLPAGRSEKGGEHRTNRVGCPARQP